MTVTRKKGALVPLALALIGWTLAIASPASAQTEPLPEEESGGYVTDRGSHVQVTEADGARYFEASESVATRPQRGSSTTRSIYTSYGSGYTVEFKNVISANVGRAEWVRYYYARTKRLSGSGPYWAEAHAVLIEGDAYEDEQVFSVYTHSCAGVSRVNATAKTCASPHFDTSPGDKWYVISGHIWDNGNDGIFENYIAGALDWVWTAPSS